MPSRKFSASIGRDPGPSNRPVNRKKKHIVARFSQEQEDKIRLESRRLVFLVTELKQEGIVPQNFGLVLKDDKLKTFFELTEGFAGKAFIEYTPQKFEEYKAALLESLSQRKVPILQTKEGQDSSRQKFVRMLLDITNI